MSGICGWFNAQPGTNAGTSLRIMQTALGGVATEARQNGVHGLSCTSGTTPSGVHTSHELNIAWLGWLNASSGGESNPGQDLAARHPANGTHDSTWLQTLKGPCAFALIDQNGRGLLTTDRMGHHAVYYAQSGNTLIFGSNAASVLAYPGLDAGLDSQSIFNYLYFHVIPAPRSIYRSVRRLLPGECLIFDKGQVTRQFYWQAPYAEDKSAPPAELAREFRSLLRQAVENCAQDPATGAFLSGGTDSSTVAGMLAQVRGAPVDTYSIGFHAEGFDETSYAKIAARHFGTRYHEYYVTPEDVVRAVPLIAAGYDEPFGNASAVPAYYCARLAADDGIHTLLAGDGGDEIFAGNARYAKQKIFELYGAVPGVLRHALIEPLAFKLPGAGAIAPLRKLRSYIEQAHIPLPDRLETYNFLHQHDIRQIFSDDFLEQVNAEEPVEDLRAIYARTSSLDPVNRMMHVDLKVTLADNDLRKVGRTSELAGMGVRYPLLDEDLVEFAGRVPASLKLKGYQLRYFFKDALKDFLPQEILKKSKHGFGLPFGLWMHEHAPLRELAYDSLGSLKQRGYLRPEYLDQLISLHRDQHSTYYGTMIWVLMMLEQWLQQHRH